MAPVTIQLVRVALELQPEEEYTLLYNLEAKLRRLIETRLSAISDHWWDECIPWKVRDRVAKRMKRRELAPWSKIGYVNLPPVCYLSIEDYVEIVTKPNNWKRAFEMIFNKEDFIRNRLRALKNIRDKVMHFQQLLPKEKRLLDKYVEEVLTRVGDWETINDRYVYTAQEAILVGETDEALRLLKDGLKQTTTEENPEGDPWLAFWMGRTLEELRKYDEAESWYRYASEKTVKVHKAGPKVKAPNAIKIMRRRVFGCILRMGFSIHAKYANKTPTDKAIA